MSEKVLLDSCKPIPLNNILLQHRRVFRHVFVEALSQRTISIVDKV